MDYSKINVKSDIGKANLLMHITNFNNISSEDFKGAFTSPEIIDYALSEESSQAWAVVGNDTRRAKSLVESFRGNLGSISHVVKEPTPEVTYTGVSGPARSISSPIEKPQILKTNQGKFKSLETLKRNMRTVYPLIPQKKIDSIFESSKGDLGLDSDVEYLDDPMFKGMVNVVKIKCDEGVVALLSGEIEEEEEKKDNVPDIISCVNNVIDIQREPEKEDEPSEPSLVTHPYVLHTQAGTSYFETWPEAVKFQKGFNKSNKTKLRATKRIK